MNALLEPFVNDAASSGRPMNVLVIFEDATCRNQTHRLQSRLNETLFADLDVDWSWCEFAALDDPDRARDASASALKADLIIIAAHAGERLPETVNRWIDLWAPYKQRDTSALLAVVGQPGDSRQGQSPIHVYLRHVAEQSGMEYLADTPRAECDTTHLTRETISERVHTTTSTLDGLLKRSSSPPRWGINE